MSAQIPEAHVVQVVAINSDEGSVVVFNAFTPSGLPCRFACDHRAAQDIVNLLAENDEPVYAAIEPWQFL